jgi:hypothetical protein
MVAAGEVRRASEAWGQMDDGREMQAAVEVSREAGAKSTAEALEAG